MGVGLALDAGVRDVGLGPAHRGPRRAVAPVVALHAGVGRIRRGGANKAGGALRGEGALDALVFGADVPARASRQRIALRAGVGGVAVHGAHLPPGAVPGGGAGDAGVGPRSARGAYQAAGAVRRSEALHAPATRGIAHGGRPRTGAAARGRGPFLAEEEKKRDDDEDDGPDDPGRTRTLRLGGRGGPRFGQIGRRSWLGHAVTRVAGRQVFSGRITSGKTPCGAPAPSRKRPDGPRAGPGSSACPAREAGPHGHRSRPRPRGAPLSGGSRSLRDLIDPGAG